MVGGTCTRSSVCPRKPLAAAAWACACAWSCWHVAYILRLVAIRKTPKTIQSYKKRQYPHITQSNKDIVIKLLHSCTLHKN
jgi:hypothetical protein